MGGLVCWLIWKRWYARIIYFRIIFSFFFLQMLLFTFYFCCIYPISLTVTGMALKFVTRYTHFSNLFYFYCLQFFAIHYLIYCKKKIVGGISKENHDYRFSKENHWSVLNYFQTRAPYIYCNFSALHSGFKCLKPAKIKWFHEIFPSKFQQIHIISVSGHCMWVIFKICQTVAGFSMIGQFHDFF